MRVSVYTDGSCLRNPGPGGWAWVMVQDDVVQETDCGNEPSSTNNRMELTAVVQALQHVKMLRNSSPTEQVHVDAVFSDSKYVIDGITKWVRGWVANGWMTAARKPVLNKEIWLQIIELSTELRLSAAHWKWVRAHNGDRFNEMADRLANGKAHAAR